MEGFNDKARDKLWLSNPNRYLYSHARLSPHLYAHFNLYDRGFVYSHLTTRIVKV